MPPIKQTQVESIQEVLGVAEQTGNGFYSNPMSSNKRREKPGIDVVLGSQWGDEGKGKLVDMLSQVSFPYFGIHFPHAGGLR